MVGILSCVSESIQQMFIYLLNVLKCPYLIDECVVISTVFSLCFPFRWAIHPEPIQMSKYIVYLNLFSIIVILI